LPLSLAQFLALVFRIFGNPVSADISNIDDLGDNIGDIDAFDAIHDVVG